MTPAPLSALQSETDHEAQQVFDRSVAAHLLASGQLTSEVVQAALASSRQEGADLADFLIGRGLVRPVDYYAAVAQVLDLPFVDLEREPSSAEVLNGPDRRHYGALNLVPWRLVDGVTLLATPQPGPAQQAWAKQRYGADGFSFVITSPYDILWQLQGHFRETDSISAREALYDWKPEHSAKSTLTPRQAKAGLVMLAMALAALVLAPYATLVTLLAASTTFYTLTFLFKFALTWIGSSTAADQEVDRDTIMAVSEGSLPSYSILVPMYREARVLPLLVGALKRLDYPASKIDVKLVLEEDDDETIEAAKALRMPGNFQIIRVPASQPKTKPKACNYALQFCKGEFVTIYDAEDQPEPDQLRKAVQAFRSAGPNLACIQARLNYFNRGENWLTRMFTLEYSQWFDFLLPALNTLKVPIPLGGTSNHFRIDALRSVGAWDPYNVTEDADLGVRLAQEGYVVGVINSTTFEEANGVLPSWIKQRSRWIKGYMQTWLVHMRHPMSLWRSIGTKGFLSFHLFVGAPPFSMLIAPVLWVLALGAALDWTGTLQIGLPDVFAKLAVFNLLIGNLSLVYFGMIGGLKRRYFDLVVVGLTLPFYWVLHSIAAYKALWQLIGNPHYWEKTEHGTSKVTQSRLAAVQESQA